MLAECSKCGYRILRYWKYLLDGTDNYNRPCDKCGGTIFKVVHLGTIGDSETHYIIYDVENPPIKCDICNMKLKGNMTD